MDPKRMRICEPGDELREPSGLRVVFIMTPSASRGRRLEMDWFVPRGGRLVVADHYHPDGPEVWRVLAGTAGYRIDGVEHVATVPHEYTVAAATPHGHPWNAGEGELNVRQIIDTGDRDIPGLTDGVQGFFETLFAFAQRGELEPDGAIKGRLQNVLTIHDMLIPGTFRTGPPPAVQRAALGGLAAVARRRGRRAYARPTITGPIGPARS